MPAGIGYECGSPAKHLEEFADHVSRSGADSTFSMNTSRKVSLICAVEHSHSYELYGRINGSMDR